jgi:hypothetical protein
MFPPGFEFPICEAQRTSSQPHQTHRVEFHGRSEVPDSSRSASLQCIRPSLDLSPAFPPPFPSGASCPLATGCKADRPYGCEGEAVHWVDGCAPYRACGPYLQHRDQLPSRRHIPHADALVPAAGSQREAVGAERDAEHTAAMTLQREGGHGARDEGAEGKPDARKPQEVGEARLGACNREVRYRLGRRSPEAGGALRTSDGDSTEAQGVAIPRAPMKLTVPQRPEHTFGNLRVGGPLKHRQHVWQGGLAGGKSAGTLHMLPAPPCPTHTLPNYLLAVDRPQSE